MIRNILEGNYSLILMVNIQNSTFDINEYFVGSIPVVINTGFVLTENTALHFSHSLKRLSRVRLG